MVRPNIILSLLVAVQLLCLHCTTNAFSSTIGSSITRKLALLQSSTTTCEDGDGSHQNNIDDLQKRSTRHNNINQRRREFVIQSIAAGIVTYTTGVRPVAAEEDETRGGGVDSSPTSIIDPSITLPKITQKVYLDIKFANYKPKRLVIGLFGDEMPKTVENFVKLCINTNDNPSYNGATFYRALSGMSIQGGAIGSNSSGKSGTSAFEGGKPFQPDNLNIRHTKAGLVSAVRTLNGDIDSRFFIQTEDDAGWADDRYAAFGIVLEEEGKESGGSLGGGMDLVRRISKVDVKTPQNSPKDPVMIVGCGIY